MSLKPPTIVACRLPAAFSMRDVRRGRRPRRHQSPAAGECLVEFFRRDLAFRHGLTEVACIGTMSEGPAESYRSRPGWRWRPDSNLGSVAFRPVDLDEGRAKALVSVGRSTGHCVEVAGCPGKTVEAIDRVRGELAVMPWMSARS